VARVLIIDDNESFRDSTADLLEAAGHTVVAAQDGDAGLAEFRRGQFDLVVCDLFMPKKDGLETVSELRQHSATVPIISTSGYVDTMIGEGKTQAAGYLKVAKEFGATCTMTKPFDPDGFLLMVKACLETHHG